MGGKGGKRAVDREVGREELVRRRRLRASVVVWRVGLWAGRERTGGRCGGVIRSSGCPRSKANL